ncbi:protein TASOR-like isoform X1 [Manis javanica]|uniref:protein TASOR-like isoform X1 n=1 Tax=Manis javanica TaxID=9974 RepID=UPI003C6D1509
MQFVFCRCVHFQILGLSSGKTIASWKPGYVVIFNLITGKVKFVSENYTANYTSPSSGCDCHVAANTNEVSHKTSHFRAFEWSQYYLYELSGSTVTEQPGQLCPYAVVAFQYREPKRMAVAAQKSVPYELDFKYIMKVSSLRKRLPEAAFRKQNYLEEKDLLNSVPKIYTSTCMRWNYQTNKGIK